MGRSIHADDSILQVDDDESGFFESRFNEFNVAPKSRGYPRLLFFFKKYENALGFVKFCTGKPQR